MRILLMTDWTASPGGSEVYTAWLRDALRRQGHEVRLLTSSAGTAADGSAEHVAYGATRAAEQVALQLVNPFAARAVRRIEREFAPDVAAVTLFEFHFSPAVVLALRRTPAVALVLNHKTVCPIGTKLLPDGRLCDVPHGLVCRRTGCQSWPAWLRDRPRYALIRAAVDRCRHVLTTTEHMRRELEINGIAAETMPLHAAAPSPGFARAPDPAPRFLFVGRLAPEKGVEVLLRAFARLPSGAHLRIVGDGPARAAAEHLARDLGASVSFAGRRTPEEIEDELARAWALVAPSLWAEPLGLVAGEALVRGVPVVASRSGGFAETVEHGRTGLLVPNGDEDALATALADVAERRAFPDGLGADAVAEARRRWDLDRHAEWVADRFAAVVTAAP